MRSPEHPDYQLQASSDGLWLTGLDWYVALGRRIDVQELHRALGEYLAETKCARCDGTGMLDDLIDRRAPCPDCRPDSALLTAQPQASAAQSAPAGEREAFAAKMRSRGGLVGWMLGWNGEHYEYQPTQDCWEFFQAGAAWQRTQSACVPEGWMLCERGIWTEEQVSEAAKSVARMLDVPGITARDLAMVAMDAAQCKAPDISLAELLAAAPAQPAAHCTDRTVEVEIEGVGCCQLQLSGDKVFMPAVTVRDVLHMAAGQDQGEVQRLREALEGMLEYFPEGASDGECFAVDAARAALAASTGQGGVMRKQPVDRPWSEYPTGTKAHAVMGGYWTKTERGWKWCHGSTFPAPGGDALSVTLPEQQEAAGHEQ